MWLALALLVAAACANYTSNEAAIQAYNARNSSYKLRAFAPFMDLDYVHGRRNISRMRLPAHPAPRFADGGARGPPPEAVDWVDAGIVSTVKNQGSCGSCWAFSAAGAVESAWSQAQGQLFNLSEQQLVDCSGIYGNQGCDGGSMQGAFEFVTQNGLCTNASYPYVARDEAQCSPCDAVAWINGSRSVKPTERHLKRAVALQPVSVAIQANLQTFHFYGGGVYSDPDCGDELDHGVLAVGYGFDDDAQMEYWLVKNSWGSDWGEGGYVRIQRGATQGGLCGIALSASFPQARYPNLTGAQAAVLTKRSRT